MAKILKQLVFGQKKNPPEPPRPDYEGDKSSILPYDTPSDAQFFEHDYENIPKLKRGSQVRFAEKKESERPWLFEEYSEPADLRAEISTLEAAEDPLYVSPVEDATAPPLTPDPQEEEEEEDMYCLPYDDTAEEEDPAPRRGRASERREEEEEEATYDLVPDEEEDDGREEPREYDEPWEWSVGARLTHTLQVSPTSSSPGDEEEDGRRTSDPEEEDRGSAMRRQYETAFDSRVRLDEELDGRVPRGGGERAASRSSFGSTSGSSASSTPTHRPTDVTRRHAALTPTERRRVTLVRERVAQPRSASPQSRPLRGSVINQNFERKISFGSSHHHHPPWDGVSRCSGSDRSSSQESMNVELVSCSRNVGRSASRDSLDVFSDRRNVAPTSRADRKESATPAQQTDPARNDPPKSAGVKVVSADDGARPPSGRKSSRELSPPRDPEPKVNEAAGVPRKQTTARPPSEVPDQSPENDGRTSRDYDPPWDLRLPGHVPRPSVNGSVSVPERLSSGGGASSLPTSVTHDPLDDAGPADRTDGLPSSRPNLNLNLSSDSPLRKGRQNLTLNFGCTALNAIGEKVDPQLTLEKQGWYHGSISRVDAEGKLRVLKEGSYLVRNSESSKQDYSLSLKSARGFMHMKIVPTSEGRFILGQFSNPFSSIPEMIRHYSVNKLPIKGAEHMSLLYPVIDQLL